MIISRASAMGRSKWLPSLTTSAGERLTMMRLDGSDSPIEVSAPRTRSRDSATALSGRPTTTKAGSPPTIWTWTSMSRTSIPWNATVWMLATMATA